MKFLKTLFLVLTSLPFFAQNVSYKVSEIPQELLENANAVVRINDVNVAITAVNSMTFSTKRVVTVLNEKGMEHMNTGEYFSNSNKVKSISAVIFNAEGQEIKKFKRRDFKETSVSEGSIITDNKLVYLDYTPVIYPFTVEYESTIETSNTAFIPSWYPAESNYVSAELSSFTISYLPELGFKFKEFNFDSTKNIKKEESINKLIYTAKAISAYKYEEYTPSKQNFFPFVMFGLTRFNLEGVEGQASDWKNFGLWMYESLLKNTDEIPIETQIKVKSLVGAEKNPVEISKIIYKYVQDKTRYISIQVGIGGWKPMLAKDVDRLGYGDCKALTNYTRALLKIVGVPSYYTVIYGDSEIKNVQKDFVSMQGNHVILGIPIQDKMYWLECTSQVLPFGFQGDFTDNRLALVIKPDGGEIIRTKEYKINENTQISKGNFTVDAKGNFNGSVNIISRGTQYDNKFANEKKSVAEYTDFYKDYFWHINDIKLKKIGFQNNKENSEFIEEIAFEAANYANLSGERILFSLNAFNPSRSIPQRYRVRNNPFEILRGFYDYDEITITIPENYTIDAQPTNFEITNKFGAYKTEYILQAPDKLLYKRSYQVNPGSYEKIDYEGFRKFKENIAKMDNAKLVLIKKL